MSAATPSQTVGPFFHIGLAQLNSADLAGTAPGERIVVAGRVIDGDGMPVNDALIEIWQADADGAYARADSAFRGFGRVPTDADGAFQFSTVKPGRVKDARGATHAPHLAVAIFMRGLLKHLVTRVYFPDEPANAADPVLALVPADRRGTLIARKVGGTLQWNVVLQGKDETIFFDC